MSASRSGEDSPQKKLGLSATSTASSVEDESLLLFHHPTRSEDAESSTSFRSSEGYNRTQSFLLQETLRGGFVRDSLRFAEAGGGAHMIVPNASSVSLGVVWVINLLGMNVCYVLSEVYQGLSLDFPLDFFLILACHLNMLSAIFVYFLGRHKYGRRHYKFYQPFVGGQKFVITQTLGVLSVAIAVVITVVYLLVFDASAIQKGILCIIAVLSDFGQLLVLLSLRYFQLPISASAPPTSENPSQLKSRTSKAQERTSQWLAILGRSPNAETAVVVALMIGQCVVSNLPSLVPRLAPPVAQLSLVIQVVIGLTIHFFIGVRHTEGYASFMLLLKRPIDTVVFWLLRFFFLCSLAAGAALVARAATASATFFICLAALNTLSSGALLLFVKTTSFKTKEVAIPITLFEYGGVAVTMAAVLLGAFNIAAITWIDRHHVALDAGIEGTRLRQIDFAAAGVAVLLGFSLLLPPLTHMCGRVLHGDTFSIFYSSGAPMSFLMLQGLGWFFCIMSVLHCALYLTTHIPNVGALAAILSVLSVMNIGYSIREFSVFRCRAGGTPSPAASPTAAEAAVRVGTSPSSRGDVPFRIFRTPASCSAPRVDAPATSTTSTSLAAAVAVFEEGSKRSESRPADVAGAFPPVGHQHHQQLPQYPSAAYILNGEMITAYIVAMCNVMLLVILDTALQNIWGTVDFPYARVYFAANLCFVLSTPLAHLSGRDKGISTFRLFSGTGTYVALQVIGWGMYALFLIVTIVTAVLTINHGMQLPNFTALSLPQTKMLFTMIGVLELIPVVIITLSIVLESRHTVSLSWRRAIAHEAFNELRELARVAARRESPTQQKILQLAFDTMMEPALRYYDIPYTKKTLRLPPPMREDGETAKHVDSSSEEDEAGGLTLEERYRRHEHVRTIMILMSCASATFYIMAAFFNRFTIISLAFAVCGIVLCTVSCIGIHAGYGFVLHGKTGAYAVFMPFKGDTAFVRRQMGGWWCYSCTLLITLIMAVEGDTIPVIATIAAAAFSVLSQVLILSSIPLFSARTSQLSFLEENGEGVVALLVFASSFVFAHIYEVLITFFSESSEERKQCSAEGLALLDSKNNHCAAADDGVKYFGKGTKRTRVPFALSIMSLTLAVPCVLMALDRATRHWRGVARDGRRKRKQRQRRHIAARAAAAAGVSSDVASEQNGGPDDEHDADEEMQPKWASAVANTLEILTLVLGTVLPVSVFFGLYYLSQNYTPGVLHMVERHTVHFAIVAVSLVAISVIPHVTDVGVPKLFLTVRFTLVAWSQYAMAVIVGTILFSPVFIYPCFGTYYLAVAAVVITILGGSRQVRMAISMGVYACIGYRTYMSYEYFREAHFSSAAMNAKDGCLYLLDVCLLVSWLWYVSLYNGNPSFTGSQRSLRFIEFARKYLFSDCVRYFNFRVIVDNPVVHMRDAAPQFLFSFHPHGVFPGTALFCTLTEEWKKKIGTNPNTYVSTHAASIVFNIPLIRDYNLRLGALSVSRKSIEASLSRGNSVLIVTGGQAEMLHTEVSSKVMTLVTHHMGFIKLAIHNRVPLVPLLSIAENNVLGLLQFPRIQRLTLKLLGFPFPMVPYGRFGLPLPYRTRLTLVVGTPIPIPEGTDENNPEHVKQLAEDYFKEVSALFYRHRATAGYPEMELRLVNDKEEAKKRKDESRLRQEAAAAAKKKEKQA